VESNQLTTQVPGRMSGIAAILALCAGWSVSALSATTTEIERDAIAHDFKSFEMPAATYSVTTIDHVSIEPGPSNLELLDVPAASSEAAAPLLFLTPRVASVLRDIFSVTGETSDQADDSEVSSSPIAESERHPDISELLDQTDQAASADDEIDLPLFQQRMFRTDI